MTNEYVTKPAKYRPAILGRDTCDGSCETSAGCHCLKVLAPAEAGTDIGADAGPAFDQASRALFWSVYIGAVLMVIIAGIAAYLRN